MKRLAVLVCATILITGCSQAVDNSGMSTGDDEVVEELVLFKPIPPSIDDPITWDNIVSRAADLSEIVYYDVYEVIERNKKIPGYNDVPHQIFRGPNLEAMHYADFDIWFDDIMAYYANSEKPDSQIFIMFPYEDLEWAVELLSAPEVNHPGYEDVMRGANLTPAQGIRQNGVPNLKQGRFDGIWVLPATLGPEGTMTTFAQHERDAFTHEYGHQVQQSQWKKFDLNGPGLGVDKDSPCYLGEGTVIGPEIALIWDSPEAFHAHTRGMGLQLLPPQDDDGNRYYSMPVTGELTTEVMIEYLKDSFNTPACTQEPNYGLSYSLGYLASEALSAIAGAEAPMALLNHIGIGGLTYDEAFSEIFGITWDEALPILAEVLAINAKEYPR